MRSKVLQSCAIGSGAALAMLYLFRCFLNHKAAIANGGAPDSLWLVRHTLVSTASDALVLLAVLAATGLLALASGRAARLVYLSFMAFVLLMAAANIRFVQTYNQPITTGVIALFKATGAAQAFSLLSYLDRATLVAAGIAALTFCVILCVPAFGRRIGGRATRIASMASIAAIIAVSLLNAYPRPPGTDRRDVNAAYWLARSLVTNDAADLPTIDVPDRRDVDETRPGRAIGRAVPKAGDRAGTVRNVILVVLESVGSSQFDLDRHPDLTPRLAAMRPNMAYFPNTYVAMPASEQSMFTLLASSYQPVQPETMPIVDATMPLPTLTGAARSAGLRTGVFMGAEWFDQTASFMASHGVDFAQDRSRRRPCPGVSDPDACAFAAMKRWIAGQPTGYLAIVWTSRTHAPYSIDGAIDWTDDLPTMLANYREGITASDRSIGDLVDWLGSRGDLDDTLVVVTGDHGEAFGEHVTTGHGGEAYEEAIRVPTLFIHPHLFGGVTDRSRIGQIDIAPTILALLGVKIPQAFEGVPLTGSARRRRTFFSVPWGDLALGYVEGDRKFVYRGISGELLIHDLRSDAAERSGLNSDEHERRRTLWRLFNWRSAVRANYRARGAQWLD